jgi:GDP/UDP-N,N'-diacetylbacillosamine 2-epimerase (hydrolysing)
MQSVLRAIQAHRKLQLQLVVTGMHLSDKHGNSIEQIRSQGWKIDATVPWQAGSVAIATGLATAELAKTFDKLKPNVVLIVGDRVEPMAAATAAHLSGLALAHVHGGDRALGQVDDCLRHAISKLVHLHFPATLKSAHRLKKMGEDAWRIHCVGSPGIDGIHQDAASDLEISTEFPDLLNERFALLVFHPVEANDSVEQRRAVMVAGALRRSGFTKTVAIYPNNDPGNAGIVRAWGQLAKDDRFILRKNVSRKIYLGLLRRCTLLAGTSSSGIIEAASFATPVIDIGPRQSGRERAAAVVHVNYDQREIATAAAKITAKPAKTRRIAKNLYGSGRSGNKIAEILAKTSLSERLLHKIISY